MQAPAATLPRVKPASSLPEPLLSRLLRNDATKGVLLIGCTVVALALANTAWQQHYLDALALPVPVPGKPLTLQLFINDFLMAIFFLLVGMELKRELAEGELRSRDRIMLPTLAALGGMVGPALIYWWFTRADAAARGGWAIPCATDIAFALGMLALLGSRVPTGLKVFLTALAVLDDLGAIIIIALFYTSQLKPWYLLGALAVLALMGLLNRRGTSRTSVYLLLGAVMWWLTLKSGVHATLAGVATALAIPMRDGKGKPVLEHFEHQLAPWVNFAILPVFALANAGVSFGAIGIEGLQSAVSQGVGIGLVAGKTIGVIGFSALGVALKLGSLPAGVTWRGLFGTAILCGIGFTMSIFIAELAFAPTDAGDALAVQAGADMLGKAKAGILLGSFVSAGIGLAVLAMVLPSHRRLPADLPID